MRSLTREHLAANAYRTLGLSASANQRAIESAARRMRIWPDPHRIPPTPWDLPWLGPIVRTRQEIDRAVARLSEPSSRLEERLQWYHTAAPPPPPPPSPPSAVEPERSPITLESAGARHALAIAALHSASSTDPAVTAPDRWRFVLDELVRFAGSADFGIWIRQVESDGDFEKRASFSEIDSAIVALPGALAAALAPQAEAALRRDDVPTCTEIVSVLRSAGSLDVVAAPIAALLDNLEDAIDAHCRQTDTELRDKLRIDHSAPHGYYPANHEASLKAARFYNSTIHAAQQRLCALCPDDPARQVRVRSQCAALLALVALGWEWSGQFVAAVQTLELALGLAEGSAVYGTILKDLERCRPLMEQQLHAEQERQARQAAAHPALLAQAERKRAELATLATAAAAHRPPRMRGLPLQKRRRWLLSPWAWLILSSPATAILILYIVHLAFDAESSGLFQPTPVPASQHVAAPLLPSDGGTPGAPENGPRRMHWSPNASNQVDDSNDASPGDTIKIPSQPPPPPAPLPPPAPAPRSAAPATAPAQPSGLGGHNFGEVNREP